MSDARLKVAVIGAGVAGITAAHILQQGHEVTLLEKGDYVGGHTRTVVIEDGPDAGTAVDTGFIVCNDKTYDNFHKLLGRLGVAVRWSDMSFGFHDERTGFQYAGTDLNGLFAQRRNLLNPRFYQLLLEIARFSRQAIADLGRKDLYEVSLGDYLAGHRFGPSFVNDYVVPMGSAIWSTAPGKMLSFPAGTFIHFFRNHGLLSLENRPRWQTVEGGSHAYVKAFLSQFKGSVETSVEIESVRREPAGVSIRIGGAWRGFDRVVFATHADQVLPLLEAPTETEKKLFGAWQYEKNRVVLHTDISVMPALRRAWASWNYTRERVSHEGNALSMTYDMNRLQGLKTEREYCVTLNRLQPIRPDAIIREFVYTHPLYTKESVATQGPLSRLGGEMNTHYCGSYFGYGFHEDAVKSGVAVGRRFALEL